MSQLSDSDRHFVLSHPLLIATHNTGKAGEIIQVLAQNPQLTLKTPHEYELQAPDEPFDTFEENAALKAQLAAKQSGVPALADDSGLVIPSLNGAPGVATADWFTNDQGQRCFETGLRRLNTALEGKSRSAHMVCTLALALPSGSCFFFSGELKGEVLAQPRSGGGFGFDPIFYLPKEGCTLSELTPQQRAQLSARTAASKKLLSALAK